KLIVATGGRHDYRIGLDADAVGNALQPEIGLAAISIAESGGCQFTLPRHSRLPELDLMLYVVEERCKRFAGRLPVQPMTQSMRLPQQPYRLHQGLHVQHHIVLSRI